MHTVKGVCTVEGKLCICNRKLQDYPSPAPHSWSATPTFQCYTQSLCG